MSLQSTGPISFSDIMAELQMGGISDLRHIALKAGFSTPDGMDEFYGYRYTHDVYIDFYYPSEVTCGQNYTFAATSDEALNANLVVTMYWYGDFGNVIQGSVTINSGASCGSNGSVPSGNAFCGGENLTSTSYYFSTNISDNQEYSGRDVLDIYDDFVGC
jgi:hypothetical protein